MSARSIAFGLIQAADLVSAAALVVIPWPVNASSLPEILGHGTASHLSKISIRIVIAAFECRDDGLSGLLSEVLPSHVIVLHKVPGLVVDIALQSFQPLQHLTF